MVIMPLPPMEIHGQLLLKLRMKQEVLFQYIYMVFVQRNNDYFFLAFNKKKIHPIFEVQPGICPALFMLLYLSVLYKLNGY